MPEPPVGVDVSAIVEPTQTGLLLAAVIVGAILPETAIVVVPEAVQPAASVSVTV